MKKFVMVFFDLFRHTREKGDEGKEREVCIQANEQA
jgi:hypothetical protein